MRGPLHKCPPAQVLQLALSQGFAVACHLVSEMERASQKNSYAHKRQKEKMDGRKKERMDGLMDGWMDGWMDRRTKG